MKSIKTLLLLACLLWLAAGAFGAQVDAETATSVVKGWLRLDQTPFGEKLGSKINSVETFKDTNGVPMYYVVYLEPSGFVIVSADDQVEPIIAFVRQGRFDPSLKNPLGALVSRDVPIRVARARARGGFQPALKIGSKWQKLLQSATGAQPMVLGAGSISDLRVAPFIQTLWNQSAADNTTNGPACYNFFTPPFAAGGSSNYVCGCVATAMAQLMYYFQYPSIGVGTPSFTISLTIPPDSTHQIIRSLRGGDGYGGPYDWGNMPLDPSGGASLAQREAIGALTYDAGVAVHMQYTPTESEALISDAKTALVNTFKYNNVILDEGTSLNVGVGLIGMINPNLDARLPVVFGIDNSAGGHCIVCDGYGYDALLTLYYHVNMGWGGDDNAWYDLPIIDLADTESYINIDACVYNVFTNGTGEIISGRVLDGGVPIANASVTAVRAGGGTYKTVTDANGIYALAGIPSTSTYTLTVTNTGYFPASSNYSTAKSSDNSTNSGNIWGADFTLLPAQGAPVITVQPGSQAVILGQNATFNIGVTGQLPLIYQWQFQPSGSLTWSNLSDGASYNGSTTETLTIIQPGITNMNGEPLRCIITNVLGSVTSSPSAVLTVSVAPYIDITTLAGSASNSGAADGIGSAALFNNPRGIAVDNNTNVYVTDLYNHTIRKLTLSGTNWVVSTIAGLAGSSGSADGTNSDARFNGPYGITVDGNTNIYVADTGNDTIRKLTPSGTNWVVSTIAGLAGSSGSIDGINSYSRFHYPIGIAVDIGGNLYVTDEGNNTIRELTPSGTNWVVNTIAGLAGSSGSIDGANSNARFNDPYGITVDGNINVYVADTGNNTIRKLTTSGANWMVNTIAGLPYNVGSADGIGSTARFDNPTGIAVGGGGNLLYVADEGNNTIRQIALVGTNWVVFTVAGLAGSSGSTDGIGSAALFNGPYAIAVDGNTNVYVADSINCTIRVDPLIIVPVPSLVQFVNQQPDGTFMLAWNAMVGHAYQVQFKTNLSQTAWITLTNVTAPNWTGSASIPVGPDPQRFYRIIPLQ